VRRVGVLDGYEREQFEHDGKVRDVYRKGSGPAVIVIAEMPGITPRVVEFADRVVALGCTAVLPHLFGRPGEAPGVASYARSIAPACVSREFAVWATGRTTPVVQWCRALARHEHERCGGPGVGAVGMCFTGGFALAMLTEDSVTAPVLSQPSLPFAITKRHKRDLHLSPEDLATVKQRVAEEDLCVIGLRFTGDRLVPRERFARLEEELGRDRFRAIEIDSRKGNPHGFGPSAHSVLTEELVDEPGHPTRDALDQVLDLFRTRLLP
jgi:dienelactone hydrolase